jgi:hypothetical protein
VRLRLIGRQVVQLDLAAAAAWDNQLPGMSITSQIGLSQVVGQDEDNVGPFIVGKSRRPTSRRSRRIDSEHRLERAIHSHCIWRKYINRGGERKRGHDPCADSVIRS